MVHTLHALINYVTALLCFSARFFFLEAWKTAVAAVAVALFPFLSGRDPPLSIRRKQSKKKQLDALRT